MNSLTDETPSTDELLEALEDLLARREEHRLCMRRHRWALREIDKHLATLRDDYGLNGLFEAAEVVGSVWGEAGR